MRAVAWLTCIGLVLAAQRGSAQAVRSQTLAERSRPPAAQNSGGNRDIDWLWIELSGGISYANLVAFSQTQFQNTTVPNLSEVRGEGPMVAGALGMKFWWLAIGARTTFASYPNFQIGTVGGELQLRIPISIIEPYVRAGIGYAWQGDANYTLAGGMVRSTTVTGWSVDAGAGVDIYLIRWLSIGAGFDIDLLNMTRQRDPTAACGGITEFCPMQNGDAIGFQLRGFAQLGLHFG